jgi:hypothetical protein
MLKLLALATLVARTGEAVMVTRDEHLQQFRPGGPRRKQESVRAFFRNERASEPGLTVMGLDVRCFDTAQEIIGVAIELHTNDDRSSFGKRKRRWSSRELVPLMPFVGPCTSV